MVAVVVNPVHEGSAEAVRSVQRVVAELGWPAATVLETTPESPGREQARRALGDGADRVVVVGGDGTVRQVADALAGSDAVLCVVPTGTANLAARNLGVPVPDRRPVDHRVTAILTAAAQRVDLGRATWRGTHGVERGSFLVTAGLGHDAAIISAVDTDAKERHGWRSYVLPALGRLADAGWPMTVDGRASAPWSLLVCNAGSIPMGLGVAGARMDDGTLHVVHVDPNPLLEWITVALAGLLPGVRQLPGITRRDTASVEVQVDSPTPAHLDGDPLGEVWEMAFTVDPGALLVARPEPEHGEPAELDARVLGALSPAAAVRLVRHLRDGGLSPSEREAVTRLVLSREGEEMEELKSRLNAGGDGHDLEHLVYDELDRGQRSRVLQHLAGAVAPRDELRVLCDIDDTFKSSLHDRRFPRGTVYPGIVELLNALDRADAAGDDSRPGDLTFVTARPGGPRDLLERYTRGGFEGMGLPAHTILTGSLGGLLHRGRMRDGKVRNIRRDAALFPECRQVFLGDSGQADADVALHVRERWPKHLVAAFIHCVTEVDEATRRRWAAHGVHAVDDWGQAARIAGEMGLVDAEAVDRVEQAVAAGVPSLSGAGSPGAAGSGHRGRSPRPA